MQETLRGVDVSNEILGPVEFCWKIADLLGDWHTMSFYSAEQFQKDVEAAKRRLRIITVKEVYAALGEGFPEGGTCHIGSYDTELSDVYLGPVVRVIEYVQRMDPAEGLEDLHVEYVYHFDSGEWVEEIVADVEVFGEDIGDEPARSFVKLLGTEFAAKLAELEAGQ